MASIFSTEAGPLGRNHKSWIDEGSQDPSIFLGKDPIEITRSLSSLPRDHRVTVLAECRVLYCTGNKVVDDILVSVDRWGYAQVSAFALVDGCKPAGNYDFVRSLCLEYGLEVSKSPETFDYVFRPRRKTR